MAKRTANATRKRKRKTAPPILTVVDRPIARVIPYARNPRRKQAIAKVAASISEFGWRQPIVVDEEGVVIVGHTRLEAARQLGNRKVPVHIARGMSDEKKRAYRLMDNRSHDDASWEEDLLRLELLELENAGYDLELTGFDTDELERLTRSASDLRTDPDKIPTEVPKRVELGQLWRLGDHRLLCADATVEENAAKVLDEQPELMVTDPPYGVGYDPSWRTEAAAKGQILYGTQRTGKVANDDRAGWLDAWKLFPGDVAYIWHSALLSIVTAGDLLEAGFEIRSQIIWRKPHVPISRGHYHWGHEPCWYAVRRGGKSGWIGDRKQSTIWDATTLSDDGTAGSAIHGTQKPEGVMGRPLDNHRCSVVYDPFVGSGTTIIAAERRGIACRAIDLDPDYCDIALKRWEDATGEKAELVAFDA